MVEGRGALTVSIGLTRESAQRAMMDTAQHVSSTFFQMIREVKSFIHTRKKYVFVTRSISILKALFMTNPFTYLIAIAL